MLQESDALLNFLFFLQEDRAEDDQSHRDPHVGEKAEHARDDGEKNGELGGPAATSFARLGPVADRAETRDGNQREAGSLRDAELPEEGRGVAEEGGERVGAHARVVQRVGAGSLAFEADEDSQGEGDDEAQFRGPDDRFHDRYCNS